MDTPGGSLETIATAGARENSDPSPTRATAWSAAGERREFAQQTAVDILREQESQARRCEQVHLELQHQLLELYAVGRNMHPKTDCAVGCRTLSVQS
jgi:hypothetical protein